MKPDFLTKKWCDLAWSEFMPFTNWEQKRITQEPGMYRIRVSGKEQIAYIGQTGNSLRTRLSRLRKGTLDELMPFNDPHVAAPRLWTYRIAEGLEFEASAAQIDLPENNRKAVECWLIWRYRLERGASTLCNFGRQHNLYTPSGNTKSKKRGRKVRKEEVVDYGVNNAALKAKGKPGDLNWMGLDWAVLNWNKSEIGNLQSVPGVYAIKDRTGQIVYIGQSQDLRQRLLSHMKKYQEIGPKVCYYRHRNQNRYELSELENDLIAGFHDQFREAPKYQFGEKSRS